MSKPTNYELLQDVHKIVNRIDDKLSADIKANTKKIDLVESKLDKIAGKIGIGVMFVTLLVTGVVSLMFDWLKSKF